MFFFGLLVIQGLSLLSIDDSINPKQRDTTLDCPLRVAEDIKVKCFTIVNAFHVHHWRE